VYSDFHTHLKLSKTIW